MNEERARLIVEAQKLMGQVESENRALTGEESEKLNKLLADVDALDARSRTEKSAARVKDLARSLEAPVGRIASAARAAEGLDRDEYRKAFTHYLRTADSSELRAMSIGTTTAGGFTVASTTEARIVEKMYQASVMRQLGVVRSTPDDRKINVENSLGTAAIVGEAASITAGDVSFTQVEVGAYKYATAVTLSRELMDDSLIDIESYLVDKLSLRIARLQDEHFYDGDNSGKPQGVVQGLSAGFTLTAGQVSTGITNPGNIMSWLHSLAPQYRRGAVILTSDQVIEDIRLIRDGGSTGQFMWEPAGPSTALRDGAAGTIAGVPYYISEFVDSIAANAVVGVYGQFQHFEIFDRGATEILVDPYSAANTWSVTVYVVKRSDSVRTLDEAFKTLKCAAT